MAFVFSLKCLRNEQEIAAWKSRTMRYRYDLGSISASYGGFHCQSAFLWQRGSPDLVIEMRTLFCQLASHHGDSRTHQICPHLPAAVIKSSSSTSRWSKVRLRRLRFKTTNLLTHHTVYKPGKVQYEVQYPPG